MVKPMKNTSKRILKISLITKAACIETLNDLMSFMISSPRIRSSKVMIQLDVLLLKMKQSMCDTSEKMILCIFKESYEDHPENIDNAVRLYENENVLSFPTKKERRAF